MKPSQAEPLCVVLDDAAPSLIEGPRVEEYLASDRYAFGKFLCPWMGSALYDGGRWRPFKLHPTKDLRLSPAAKALHYGLEIFEGLKAFRQENGIALFRPQDHGRRMARSAEALAMPPYPVEEFVKNLADFTAKNKDCVPAAPNALYIRPVMLGISPQLGVGSSPQNIFYILATPSRHPAKPASSTVWVTPDYVRAAKGGLGGVKAAANYAASVRAIAQAKEKGFQHVLFLDAVHRRYVEELSGMNFFCVDGGKLKTPPAGETVLPGITRDALIRIAAEMKVPVEEIPIDIGTLCEGLSKGRVTELFACGTGACVESIAELGWKGKRWKPSPDGGETLTSRLHRALLDSQFGRRPVPQDWLVRCA